LLSAETMALVRKRQIQTLKLIPKPKTTLLTKASTLKSLEAAWNKLNKSNPESRGLSNETISDFKSSLKSHIKQIQLELRSGNFKFGQVKAHLLPKKEKDKFRPLRIGDIKDRLVQKAISLQLERLLSKKYNLDNPCSFAYLEDKGIDKAIKAMVAHFKNGNRIILEADIKKFFDSVNRQRLLDKVFKALPDQSLNNLIEDALSQTVGNMSFIESKHKHYFEDSINGIPQGNSISPLLANIYLSGFDKRMMDEKICLVRYADDFIILCKSADEAQKALLIARDELENKLELELHSLPTPNHAKNNDKGEKNKTRIIDPFYHEFSFLSIRFDGKKLWPEPKKIEDFHDKLKDIIDVSQYRKGEFQGILTIIKRFKNLLEGYLAAYKFVDIDRNFQEIDNLINHYLLNALLNLGFKIKESHTQKFYIKSKKKELNGITTLQRKNIGVPLCIDFIKKIERNQIIL